MAINDTRRVKFVFQNSNGVYYDVDFVYDTGVGVARKHGLTIKSTPMYDASETAVTVDGGSLTDWQAMSNSARQIEAVYNTTQALNAILNAAS
jgi:hypothetical protein